MEQTLSNSNVNSVVLWLNGFVGEILIFVIHATKDNVVVILSVNIRKINFQNAKALVNAPLEEIIKEMVLRDHLDALFVEIIRIISKPFDIDLF